jgi:O-antigen ligase
MFSLRPFTGTGPDTYQLFWVAAFPGTNLYGHAHNWLLNILAESGYVGVAGFATLAAAVVTALWQRRGTPLGRGALAALAALGTQSIGDVPTTATYISLTAIILFLAGAHSENSTAN